MKYKLGIVGLGYVGLPLAVEFAKKYEVVGFDISEKRVAEIKKNTDTTCELTTQQLAKVNIQNLDKVKNGLFVTQNPEDLEKCNFYIITVPTPIDRHNRPVLTPLLKASETISKVLKKGDFVIYESTVYPGATEEKCLPVLEKFSGLKLNLDFYIGYSPERINPGDKEHTVTKIKKVTSGSNEKAAVIIDNVYSSIITAGTYSASSIKVAEAAKVIENSQRDINIAFVNELAKIFSLMNINTKEVLEAASTKWNFLPFKPGLVGGHCIGVDPYYLAQKAMEFKYNPEIILSGRRINNSMGKFVADEVIKNLIKNEIVIKNSSVLILGITFKENCPDIRNTGVTGIIERLEEFQLKFDVYDPWASISEVHDEYGILISNKIPKKKYEAIILAVAHNEFTDEIVNSLKKNNRSIIYDVKGHLKESTKSL